MNEGLREQRIRVVRIEEDAPVMRSMAWALEENGFEVEVVSEARSLEMRGLEGFDVAVFSTSATAVDKTALSQKLRAMNPDVILIDVDEFMEGGGSVRDSGADEYTERPLNLDAVTAMIREMVLQSPEERQEHRDERERELRDEL